jgi:hypothetical protein
MVKKIIAAAMMIAMVAWAEMALAPMLAMQGHVHPPVAVAEHAATHRHAMPAGHACCPKIGETREPEDSERFEVASGSLPCAESHRCCFQQGPQNVPGLVSVEQRFSQEVAPVATGELAVAAGGELHDFSGNEVASGPPPSAFGMVVRI